MTDRDTVQLRVDGMPKLRRDLRQLGDDLGDLRDANERAGQVVLQASKPPRLTGRLAGSGRVSRAVGKVTVLFGGARIPWAGPIHWGWPAHNIDPQPFVVDAAQATEPVWVPMYEEAVQRSVDKLGGRTY